MKLFSSLKRFLKARDGNATIEFVIIFPLFFGMFLAAFELGLMQVRHTMLERGLDIAVRSVRLSTAAVPSYDSVKENICEHALVLPECEENLRLEMVRVNPWQSFQDLAPAKCVDTELDISPVQTWIEGGPHDLMLMRACILFDPMFPTTGIGYAISIDNTQGGAYALTALTAFVTEPD